MILTEILANSILIGAVAAWAIAQFLKLMINLVIQRKFDLDLLMSSGGFPSSHSAMVCSLAISIGRYIGWSTPTFAIATVFALIVMYDAAGVRHAAGKQAQVLNILVEKLYPQGSGASQERLKELIGHTPFEVFGGALLGLVVGLMI